MRFMFIKFVYTLWDLILILKYIRFKNYYQIPCHRNNQLRIYGNGKSLENMNVSYDKYVDSMVVNGHVYHPSFSILKPSYYCLIDAEYFSEKYDNGCNTLKAINEKTSWNMYLYVPYSSNNFELVSRLIINPLISIVFFSPTYFRGFEKIKYWLYKHNYAAPKVFNIMSVCIMQAISMKYERVELFGVEHNWTKCLTVGDDNLVYLENSHFYDKILQTPEPFYYMGEKVFLHQALFWYSAMFRSYHEITDYIDANKIPIKIINKTKGSFIDAFVRE